MAVSKSGRLRVLVVNDYQLEYGGAETYVFGLLQLLKARGHEVRLVGDKPRWVHYFSRIGNPWYLLKFLFMISTWRPDVVHINKYNLVYSFMPALAGWILGRRVVITMHDVGLFCPDGFGLRPNGSPCELHLHSGCFSSRCFRTTSPLLDMQRRLNFVRNSLQVPIHGFTVQRFICPSTHMVEWVERAYGSKAVLLPNFLDAPKIDPPLSSRAQDGVLRLFFAGRLVREKGIQIVLQAIPDLNVHVTLAGEGKFRPELERLALELGIQNQVTFLGKVPNHAVAQSIQNCDACILPSLWLENNPLFAFEAMKSARALVGAKVGGIPDLIEDGVNGRLFHLGDAEDLRRVLQDMIKTDLCSSMGLAGLEKLRRDLGPTQHLEKLEAIYRGSAGFFEAAK